MALKRRLLAALTCILAALALLAGMAGQAWAEGEGDATSDGGSITITNAAPGKTYNVYKVFDLTMHTSDQTVDSYAYTISNKSPWYEFFSGTGAGARYVNLTQEETSASDITRYSVTWKDGKTKSNGETTEDFNKAMFEYLSDQTDEIQAAAKSQTNTSESVAQLTFKGLSYGYYLVTSDMGALISLDSTNPSAEVQEKNTLPTLTKFVYEKDAWVAENDAAIGEEVTFRLVIDAKYGASNYVVKDTLSNGFTFEKESVKVWAFAKDDPDVTVSSIVGDADNLKTDNEVDALDANYTVTDENQSGSFVISFSSGWLSSLQDNSWIVIEYKATVNSLAVDATMQSGNAFEITNVAVLNYGDNQKTTEEKTTTKIWSIPVHKFYKTATDDDLGLAGAVFSLAKADVSNGTLKFIKVSGDDSTDIVYRLALNSETENAVTEVTTPSTGNLTFQGLDSGTYYLIEVQAPHGFNKLTSPDEITVGNDGTIKVKDVKDGEITVNTVGVENKTGTELPSTGGMGTTVIYIIGGVLVAAAVVLLVAKKKVSSGRK